jgi:diguanylate cyclase (GGDEF)-like protein
MTHDDFTTLDLKTVLSYWVGQVQKASPQSQIHWITSALLNKVRLTTDENWQWIFDSALVMGTHIYCTGQNNLWSMFATWKSVENVYGNNKQYRPQDLEVNGKNCLVYPVMWQNKPLGYLLFEGVHKATSRSIVREVTMINTIASRYVAFAYEMYDAKSMSYMDDLTGLYNQRYLPMVLEHEIERSKRSKQPFSVLFLDVDYFKMVNDSRGHLVGSKLLIEISHILKQSVRSCDYSFRYGGDEFLVVLVGTDPANGKMVAERIRKTVEDHAFAIEGHQMKLTVSIGLAGYPEHAQSAQGVIQLADQAMYYGKHKSRNIVFVAS